MSIAGGKVWLAGAIVDVADAKVSVLDRGFLYGDSVYEVARVFGGRAFLLAEHLERLAFSAGTLAIALPARAAIETAVADTIAAAGAGELYVRIVVTRGAGTIGLDPALADAPNLVVFALPVQAPAAAAYTDGVTIGLTRRGRYLDSGPSVSAPQAKSGNYLGSIMALKDARDRGEAFEALFIDSAGRLTECSSSNFFVVQGRTLLTTPLSAGILDGITRRVAMELGRASGLVVAEQPMWSEHIWRADEAFITSSIRGIVPVVKVRDLQGTSHAVRNGKPGPRTLALVNAYDARCRATI